MMATEVTTSQKRSDYLAKLAELRSPLPYSELQGVRDRATHQLQTIVLPSIRDEEWRFTDVSALLSIPFQANTAEAESVSLDEIQAFLISEAPQRLVFVNGNYCSWLSTVNSVSGWFIGDLAAAMKGEVAAHLVQALGQQLGHEEAFTQLNSASFTDAAVIWVGKNQQVEQPIHLLFVSLDGAAPLVSSPKAVVLAEESSSVNLIEEYVSLGENSNLTNAVTEMWLSPNAQVTHTRIQQESHATFHVGKTAVSQARNSRYHNHTVSVGAKLSRHHLEIYQTGEQTETTLNGLTMIAGEQVGDMHSTIALTSPYGVTRQLQKNIADDKAHAVFNGKVFVPRAAQLTDAGQLNRNLLLSPKARIDTKPQLEIVADNVKCTHGATVSQLEDDEVFYLQSRGIDAMSAQKLLVYAFAFEVISKIPIASLQSRLSQLVNVLE
jgi:Fe-S cluster assembly protein SufD